jgi:hypothetical protein
LTMKFSLWRKDPILFFAWWSMFYSCSISSAVSTQMHWQLTQT